MSYNQSQNSNFLEILFMFLAAQELLETSRDQHIEHSIDEIYSKIVEVQGNQDRMLQLIQALNIEIKNLSNNNIDIL